MKAPVALDSSIKSIFSIGKWYALKLEKLGINTVRDLIYHFPHRYDDFALTSSISQIQPGETVTIKGQVLAIQNIYTRGGKRIQKAIVSDGEDKIDVTWFNQPYLVKTLAPGTQVSLSGKVNTLGAKKVFVSPEYEKIQSWSARETVHTGRLVPVYPETEGVSSKWLRAKITRILPQILNNVEDFLPEKIRRQNNLIGLREAIQLIHFPASSADSQKATRRLEFDEFFKLQLRALLRKKSWKETKIARPLEVPREKVLRFISSLPFELTQSQKTAIREILRDLTKKEAMNRLLEGDVGSGKTIVAALACFVACHNSCQSLIMAPTQILANQHYLTLNNVLAPLGIRVELFTREKKTIRPKELDRANVIVGTHSLLQKGINLENLALTIIDEQHRFGVAQRSLLAQKGLGPAPHVLTMTATPIPRTVALTLYGDLDLSVLTELPAGRQVIRTWVVPPKKRDAAYDWIKKRVKDTDEQAFIVCPLIDESEVETMKSVKAVNTEFENLKKKVFPDLRLALLHGRMKASEKEETMEKMKKGEIDILVATPVVEVGIDISNATIMMIEGSERFGLAQLHQLRGRVGRGSKQSYCLLFTEMRSPWVLTRLKAMEKNLSGSELANLDLRLRGAGEIYGVQQHGFPELKIGSYADVDLIKSARSAAEETARDTKQAAKFLEEEFIAPN